MANYSMEPRSSDCSCLPRAERRVRKRPRAWRAAGLVLLCSLLMAAFIVCRLEQYRLKIIRERVEFVASDFAGKIRYALLGKLSTVHTLDLLLRLGHGSINNFDDVAREILEMHPTLRNVSLAPGGVVSQIAPLETNRAAIGHDLLNDPARSEEAVLARDSGRLTVAGPFSLVQGGEGVAVRQPVFLPEGDAGPRRFWGFIIVTFRFPDMLSEANLKALTDLGYAYELWRMHPDTEQKQVLFASGPAPLLDPLEKAIELPNGVWVFGVTPAGGWRSPAPLIINALVALALCLLLAALAGLLVNLTDKKKMVERMSRTDALTGLPNRRNFLERLQEEVDAVVRQGGRLAVCYLDLDGFKRINDTLGHAAGDELLVEFAARLLAWLEQGELSARLGGDEFVAAFRVRDHEHAVARLNALMRLTEKSYTLECLQVVTAASLGVSCAPDDGTDAEKLLIMADQALYRAKRGGKHQYCFWEDHDADLPEEGAGPALADASATEG